MCGRYSTPLTVKWLELMKIPNVDLLRVREESSPELPCDGLTTFHGFYMLNRPQSTCMVNLDVDKVPCHMCAEPDDTSMLMREGCNAAFHMSCIGLTTVPASSDYYCEHCGETTIPAALRVCVCHECLRSLSSKTIPKGSFMAVDPGSLVGLDLERAWLLKQSYRVVYFHSLLWGGRAKMSTPF
jgi:hypothetical protein